MTLRDGPNRLPRIKGLLTSNFDGQLDYIAKHYSVCKLADVVEASRGERELPTNACVLTFDDGLADHYQTVYPRLLERGFTGAFFPPARPLQERCVLDVHKIQFVLAAMEDHDQLAAEILEDIADIAALLTSRKKGNCGGTLNCRIVSTPRRLLL